MHCGKMHGNNDKDRNDAQNVEIDYAPWRGIL